MFPDEGGWTSYDAATAMSDSIAADPVDTDIAIEDDLAEEETPDEETKKRRPWKLIITSVVLLTLAALAGGLLLGYRWATDKRIEPRSGDSVNIANDAADAVDPTQDLVMPDVRGLTEEQATEALLDNGLKLDDVKFESIPWVGEPGRVAKQEPVARVTNPSEIVIYLSTEATVPELVGKTEVEAARAVEAMGAVLQLDHEYVPDQPTAGLVVETEPGKGDVLVGVVRAKISAEPTSQYLTALDADSGGCSKGEADIPTGVAAQALTCSSTRDEPSYDSASAVYLLGQQVDQFEGRVAISPSEEPSATAQLRIVGDGEVLHDAPVPWGEEAPFTIDVRGVTRLEIWVRHPSEADSVYVVLADPTLKGSPDAIASFGS